MLDRIQTSKIDSRLLSLMSSPYAQQPLKIVGLTNHRNQLISYDDYLRSLSRRKRRQQEREVITHKIVTRALKIDQNHQRSRRHQFEIAARRVVNNNFEILSRQNRKQSQKLRKPREKSAPGYLMKGENDGETRSRVTSVYNRQLKTNKDLLESDYGESRIEPLNRLNVLSLERHACEVTMTYRPLTTTTTTTKTEKPLRDEIVVMQQHSTGENLVVYRGFIAKDESFSFKSQRRPVSPLSLAFYAKGFIDSIVNDCCEYRYSRRDQQTNEHSQFLVERVRKASPCERCRKKYSRRALTPSVNNTLSDVTRTECSHKIRTRHLTPVSKLPIEHQEQNSSPRQHYENKRISKKYSTAMNSRDNSEDKDKQVTNERKHKRIPSKSSSSRKSKTTENLATIDFGVLESALVDQTKPSKQFSSIESSTMSSINEKFTTHSEITIQEKPSPKSIEEDRNNQQLVNQREVPFWDSSSEYTTIIDSGNIFPLFMDHLQQLQKYQDRSTDIVRHEKSVENFIYILDNNLQISHEDKRKLRGLINFGLIFDDINNEKCKEFINHITHEQIIMILSKTSMQNLDTSIKNTSQVRLIYVIGNTNDSSINFEKIQGIYSNISSVCHQLENDIKSITNDLTTISTVAANDTSDSTFAYIQILKDILLEIDEHTDLKKEMLDFCRHEYTGNDIQLKYIDEFEHHFRPDEAIKWYIREETFVYKMLQRAFKIPDPDILYKLRFFIQHLHRQLKSNISPTPITVYRSQYLSKDDFDMILKNHNGFLSFNQFLFTTKDKIIPKQESINIDIEYKLVLFQMELGITTPKLSLETNPEKVLLTTATTFHILNIEQKDKEIPIIKLISNDDISKSVHDITKDIRESTRGSFPLIRMAKLMKHMEFIQHTEYFCNILMNDSMAKNNEAANLIVGGLFHILCSFYYEQEEYDHALEQLEKSLQVYLRVLSPNDIKLTPTYNNIGSIYHKQGLDDQALQFHKKAYDIQIKSSNPDPDSIAAYAGNIASVLIKQGKYEEAIPYLQRDLQIRQHLYPNNDDLNLAVKYHNLAGVQFRINKYAEALENYKKCLDIELKIHPSNHPTVSVTYYNMATTLEGLGQLEEAIETIQKARQRLLLTRNENDEEVEMHNEYEKRLQQKLWVKSLFGTV